MIPKMKLDVEGVLDFDKQNAIFRIANAKRVSEGQKLIYSPFFIENLAQSGIFEWV